MLMSGYVLILGRCIQASVGVKYPQLSNNSSKIGVRGCVYRDGGREAKC